MAADEAVGGGTEGDGELSAQPQLLRRPRPAPARALAVAPSPPPPSRYSSDRQEAGPEDPQSVGGRNNGGGGEEGSEGGAVLSRLAPLLWLALPSFFGVCLERWWYEIMTVLAGYLPNTTTVVAATSILIQTTSLVYTVPMALAACVSNRVGNELGTDRPRQARLAVLVALGCAFIMGIIIVVCTALFQE